MKGNVVWEGNILQIIVGPDFWHLGQKSPQENSTTLKAISTILSSDADSPCVLLP